MTASMLVLAVLLDRWIGDPRWLPHPVIGMGWLITRVESMLRRMAAAFRLKGKWPLRLVGCLFPLTVVGIVYGLAVGLVGWVTGFSVWVGWVLEIILIATTIASKGLAEAGMDIFRALTQRDLPKARASLAMVVGRDTEHLDEPEVVRGAVETVAENIVDAVTSPLFFAAFGGAPLALAYRAVNTLDSMVGYKNERYLHLGWASARLDDLANWLPARLTLPAMLAALRFAGASPAKAWRIVRRDAAGHPSPNSGITEAAMAGGLGIQLGGTNHYQGRVSYRARLGDPCRPRERQDIDAAVQVLYGTTAVYVAGLSLLVYWFPMG
ncbi:adenosylcobinamide-phosphate synthase CbiB [Salinithrix halophila]|uniref:Cobalamin biosynthesis protein CobD n=1 Tax=Salinithrix halophila TaxID=1485204 RepID=A0ABV8JCK7_9BACL